MRAGTITIAGVAVRYADIFLGSVSAAGIPDFGYAIALGYQAKNGGLAAGFYSATNDETSQAIWGSRAGFIYGGAYGQSAAWQPGQSGYSAAPSPTVLTTGTKLGGANVTDQALTGGWYDLTAQITLTAAQAAYFDNGMDVFWGTGDCANGAFLAQLSGLPMPEHCSFAVLASGLFYLLVRRRGGAVSNGFGIQRIARRAHGADQIQFGLPVNRLTQTADMNIHRPWFDMDVRAPHGVQKFLTRKYPARMLHEEFQ